MWRSPWFPWDGYRLCAVIYQDGSRAIIEEHREVMERVLGRALTADEVVHHKNEKRDDNRPENLEVMTRAEHARLHARERARRRRIAA
jgi:hypothetical protein